MNSQIIKTSRRDIAYVVGKGLNGGTTVSGTIIFAKLAGIDIFATGGIGGVHRNVEKTMDVSADLVELGRNSITVVSSGIKSILDIPKSLEYLVTINSNFEYIFIKPYKWFKNRKEYMEKLSKTWKHTFDKSIGEM